MYAIVDIAGHQFKVSKNDVIVASRLPGAEGDKIEFDKVMLVSSSKAVKVGSPYLEGSSVTAKIVSHGKADTVKVFKKKRRKGYQVLNGHRQPQTTLKIEKIVS